MTATKTPRLDLTKESDDEFIDQYPVNWPILDLRAGEMIVANGTTPPDNQLFDGIVVREATSGKSWIAAKQPNGTYTKKWLTYPWQACVYSNTFSVGSVAAGNYTAYTFSTWHAGYAVNSVAGDLVAGQLILPMAGIYSVHMQARWTDADASDSQRWACIRLNNVSSPEWNEDGQHTNSNIVSCTCTQQLTIQSAQPVEPLLWQNSGSPKNVNLTLFAQMVSPL